MCLKGCSLEIDSLCIASAESGGSGKRIKAVCGWSLGSVSECVCAAAAEMTLPTPPRSVNVTALSPSTPQGRIFTAAQSPYFLTVREKLES